MIAGPRRASSSIVCCRHHGAGIIEQLRRARSGSRFSQSMLVPRVASGLRADLSDAIDRPQHVGLHELRRRAAELVPAAGVDDEQAAVGVFEHVGRMEVDVVARRRNRRSFGRNVAPVGFEHVPADFAQVELAAKRLSSILLAELSDS